MISKSIKLMMIGCVSFLVVACQSTLTEPCDVLVELTPSPATNTFIVQNDKKFAQGVARHRGRFAVYKCEGKNGGSN